MVTKPRYLRIIRYIQLLFLALIVLASVFAAGVFGVETSVATVTSHYYILLPILLVLLLEIILFCLDNRLSRKSRSLRLDEYASYADDAILKAIDEIDKLPLTKSDKALLFRYASDRSVKNLFTEDK